MSLLPYLEAINAFTSPFNRTINIGMNGGSVWLGIIWPDDLFGIILLLRGIGI